MNHEEQLLTTGRVIDAARKIESRLVECGASGSGLREKADSLGSALPEEAVQLIHFVGTIRNRVAHESGTTLRPDELELFEEATEEILLELDKIAADSAAPTPETAAAPPRKEREEEPPAEKTAVPRNRSPRSPAKPPPEKTAEPLLPPWNSPMWNILPGLHLVYVFGAGWSAFGAGQLYLLLILAELIALTALGFAAALASLPLAAAGGVLFLAIYGCGVWLGLSNPPDAGGRAWYCLIPLANFWFFAGKIIRFIDPAELVVSLALLGIWLAAVQLAIYREFTAAGVIACASWLGALIDSLRRRR